VTDWHIEGEWFKNCNCDPGCSCDINQRPTQGYCAGMGARRITKGYFGEYAAGGALQLVAALLAVADQTLHASCGFESGDDAIRIEVVRECRPAALRHVLVNSLSAGGGIVCAVVSREAA